MRKEKTLKWKKKFWQAIWNECVFVVVVVSKSLSRSSSSSGCTFSILIFTKFSFFTRAILSGHTYCILNWQYPPIALSLSPLFFYRLVEVHVCLKKERKCITQLQQQQLCVVHELDFEKSIWKKRVTTICSTSFI